MSYSKSIYDILYKPGISRNSYTFREPTYIAIVSCLSFRRSIIYVEQVVHNTRLRLFLEKACGVNVEMGAQTRCL